MRDLKRAMLYFAAYRIGVPKTGGELYNQALLEGARQSGFDLCRWEGLGHAWAMKKLMVMNMIWLLKAFRMRSHALMVVDFDFFPRCVVAVLWAKLVKRCRIGGVLHHFNFREKSGFWRANIHRCFGWLGVRCADFIITNSAFSVEEIRNIADRRPPVFLHAPFARSHAGETPTPARFDPKEIRLVTVATIEPRKNIHAVLRAMRQMERTSTYHIVGRSGGAYYRGLLRYVDENNLQGKVFFHGWLERDGVGELLRNSTAFILMSLLEGYGMVYAEAMKYGLPIIASNRGAIPEIVTNGINGILCDPTDIKAICCAIDSVHEPERWAAISARNREKFNTFVDREAFVARSREMFQGMYQGTFVGALSI